MGLSFKLRTRLRAHSSLRRLLFLHIHDKQIIISFSSSSSSPPFFLLFKITHRLHIAPSSSTLHIRTNNCNSSFLPQSNNTAKDLLLLFAMQALLAHTNPTVYYSPPSTASLSFFPPSTKRYISLHRQHFCPLFLLLVYHSYYSLYLFLPVIYFICLE